MKLRRLPSLLGASFLIPTLLAGCEDDPSGPVDEIYTAQTVQVDGAARPLPAVLYNGPATGQGGTTFNIDYQLRQATLLLLVNGRYEFSGTYRLRETNNVFEPFNTGAVEFGTYTRSPTSIEFRPDNASDQFLSRTGTLRSDTLSVTVVDPLFEEENVYTFRR